VIWLILYLACVIYTFPKAVKVLVKHNDEYGYGDEMDYVLIGILAIAISAAFPVCIVAYLIYRYVKRVEKKVEATS
jgi:hypothetical protein